MARVDDKRKQEHEHRVKKLKARTSKLRLAIVNKKKKKTAEELEEERYNKAGNFVSDTYVDDKGDMYTPKKSM